MILSKGWLKPIKLKEITGIPAADVIAKELKEDKLRKKKEEYIRKYHSRMAKEGGKGFTFAPISSANQTGLNPNETSTGRKMLSKDSSQLTFMNN